MLSAATLGDLLDSVAVKVNAEKADGEAFTLQIVVPDEDEIWQVELANSNLSYIEVSELGTADTTLTLNRADLLRLLTGQLGATEIVSLGSDALEGSIFTITTLLGVLDRDERFYDMVPMPE